jgi:hypothetical protein
MLRQQREAAMNRGGDGGGGDKDQGRVPTWILVYEILTNGTQREVYDSYFMPSLTSSYLDSVAFLRGTCSREP